MRLRRWGWAGAAVVLALAGPVAAAGGAPASESPSVAPVRSLVVVAVPGLRWSDVARLRALRAFADKAAIGNLTVGQGHPLDAGGGSRSGALGDALHNAGWRTVAFTRAAVPLLATGAGQVDRIVLAPTAGGSPRVGVVGVDPRVAAAWVDDELSRPAPRAESLSRLDDELRAQLTATDDRTMAVVAGISDAATGPAQSHVLAISAPGWGHAGLTSGTTQRSGWAQLVDLAPTLLDAAGLPVPTSMTGKPVRPSGPAPSIAGLVDDGRHARAAAVAKFWTVSGICLVAGIAVLLLLARRRRLGAVLA